MMTTSTEDRFNRPAPQIDFDALVRQLGGPGIFAMAFEPGRTMVRGSIATFRIAKGLRAIERATHVLVHLTAADTYDVDVYRVRGKATSATIVAHVEDVHADQIRRVVEDLTGLRLTLGMVRS